MWQGEVVKSIIFPAGEPRTASELWREATGQEPDNTQRRGLPMPLHSTASGIWEGYTLNVVAALGRIEANLTMTDPNPGEPAPIPPIASEVLGNAIDLIRQVAHKMHKGQACRRFAAVTQLVQRVSSMREGVERINTELDNIFPLNSESSLYQINITKHLAAGPSGGEMNRLCKWGVARLGGVEIAIDQAGLISRADNEGIIYAYCHLDINNKAFDTPASTSEADKVIGLLWDEEARLRAGGRNAL